MANKKGVVLPVVAGVGIGALSTYALMATTGVGVNYDAVRPRVDLTLNGVAITPTTPVNVGVAYQISFVNYPANTQLVAIQTQGTTGPPQLVNVGTTDANGQLRMTATAMGPPGTYYVHAWDAPSGKYIAIASLFVVAA